MSGTSKPITRVEKFYKFNDITGIEAIEELFEDAINDMTMLPDAYFDPRTGFTHGVFKVVFEFYPDLPESLR